MEAKNNLWDKLRGGKHDQQPEPSAQSGEKGDATQSTSQSQTPATMRKGIYLSALIYIEGDQPPAENFNAHAKAALKDRLDGKNSPEYAGLTMTLKKVEEQTDVEEDGKESDKGGKFEF